MLLFLLMATSCCVFMIATTSNKTISLPGGAAIHLRWTTIEKRIGYKVTEWGRLSLIESLSKTDCSQKCLKHPQCRGFVRARSAPKDSLKDCVLVDGVPETKTIVFQKDNAFTFFEFNVSIDFQT